jgi:histidyl-tRNA synthetase
MKYQRLRGVKDVVPEITPVWEHIIIKSSGIFKLYDYRLIITPTIEEIGLFVRGIGEGSDIVMKEMYDFKDKKGRHIVLRPEGTAGVVRAYIENNMGPKSNLYYLGQMFRYERPQAGRYREFFQIGVEAFGDATPYKDAEVIRMAADIIAAIGVTGSVLHINCLAAEDGYYEKLKTFLETKRAGLCGDCLNKLERAPIRVLDCKNETCKKAVMDAPLITQNLKPEAAEHYSKVKEMLVASYTAYVETPTMVRGLDYYTGTVFEFTTDKLGPQQNTILAGGRYDNLVEELGGKKTPATGFALGMERMAEVLTAEGRIIDAAGPDVFVVADKAYLHEGFDLLNKLRAQGVKAAMSYEGNSFKSQFREAESKKSRFVVIIGENEIKTGSYALKNMATGAQQAMDLECIVKEVKNE